jgi:hypothetical protein
MIVTLRRPGPIIPARFFVRELCVGTSCVVSLFIVSRFSAQVWLLFTIELPAEPPFSDSVCQLFWRRAA